MNNNNFRYAISPNDRSLNIPVSITFDNEGREDGIREFESDILKTLINGINDFETTKFANATYPLLPSNTDISYKFSFFNTTNNILTAPSTAWEDNYNNTGFFDNEIYYFSNSFKNSFFKLDLYDTKTNENQRAYISVIIPTQQGLKKQGNVGFSQFQVYKPSFVLDYVGADKEGFLIYWLKERDYIDITEFYMTAKFFNGKTGQFIRFMNEPQSLFNGNDKFNFDKSQYFYYKIIFDYNNYEYAVYKEQPQVNQPPTLFRVGDTANPINWYEYVNP